MKVGEIYKVTVESLAPEDGRKKRLEGKVVFVHPQGRFATLEFKGVNGPFRETFRPDQLTEKNRVLQKKK